MVPIGTASRGGDLARKKKETLCFTDDPLADLPPRRHAILAAAFAVLMEQGYAGASTLEIASRAKVSKRELYAEFGSKAGILEALIATTAARMQAPLDLPRVVDRRSLADTLTRYGIRALTELSHPAVTAINRLAAAEAGGGSEIGKILDRAGREPNRLALGRLMAQAQAAGLLANGDADRMSGEFFSLLFGDLPVRLMLGVVEPPDAREIARRTKSAVDAVLRLHSA